MKQGYAQDCSPRPPAVWPASFPASVCKSFRCLHQPLWLQHGACTYCGFANASAAPIIQKPVRRPACFRPGPQPTFEARTDSEVTKVNLSNDGKTATGVPMSISTARNGTAGGSGAGLCLRAFNVRCCCCPASVSLRPRIERRVVAATTPTNRLGSRRFSRMRSSTRSPRRLTGVAADDYNSDNFDHRTAGFVGGASITCAYTNGRPFFITRRRRARRPGEASGKRRSKSRTSGSPASALRAAS